MLLIRQWLLARSIPAPSRAAALLIAGMTVPMLRFSTDIVEAIIPATIALAGLVYLASRPPEKVNQGLWVAAAAIAFAALLYQGIILAVALVPCAIPRGATIRTRTIVVFCVILAVTPLVMVTTIVASGTSPRTAIHLMLTGEENVLYREIAWRRIDCRYGSVCLLRFRSGRREASSRFPTTADSEERYNYCRIARRSSRAPLTSVDVSLHWRWL
jgi:hypothetical protein